MLNGLDPSTVNRLAKVTARLASSFDGERANAAALASRLLADCGLSWEQLVTRAFQAPSPTVQLPTRAPHVAEAQWALRFPSLLDEWEHGFLANVGRFRRLSPKQRASLDGILRKIERRTA